MADASTEDLEALEAWQRGDRDAGERLMRRHYTSVLRFFELKATAAADDLTQRTFLACMEGRDRFRGEGVEIAAVSREPHHIARKQAESTGIDRFLSALSARGTSTDAVLNAVDDCLAFMEHEIGRCALVSPDERVLRDAAGRGLRCFEAAWGHAASGQFPVLKAPRDLLTLLDPSDRPTD